MTDPERALAEFRRAATEAFTPGPVEWFATTTRRRRRRRMTVLASAVVLLTAMSGLALGHGPGPARPVRPPADSTSPAVVTSSPGSTPESSTPTSPSPVLAADLVVDASDLVLVEAEGDTRWRGELVMTVRAKSGSTAKTRLTFQLNQGISALAAPHPGGDPAGSLASYNCTATGAGYDCDLGALKAGSSVTVRLKVSTDMPGIAFVPEPVTVTELTTSGQQVEDAHPADNTTRYATRAVLKAGADLAVDASDVVLVRPDGDTRWRSELVMTVRAKSGSTAKTRLTFQLNQGVSVLAAPHPGGDPAGSLMSYNCTATGAGYDCDLGALKAGSSVTVRLKVSTDMPGIAFVPEPVTVTELTTSGLQVEDAHPADNTTQYTTQVA